jgi:3-oxoacyl-[acyl-carrier protein] reductase
LIDEKRLAGGYVEGDKLTRTVRDILRPDLLPPREAVARPVSELLDLRGKRAAVTGGAGANLGQAIVGRLAGLGASVAVLHRAGSAASAARVAAEAAERWGVDVIPVEADVAQWDAAHQAAHRVAERLGGLDIWVNSAGSGADGGAAATYFAEYRRQNVDATITGYLTPTLYGTHAALDVMLPRKHGRIINIASTAGLTPYKRHAVYGAVKAAIISFTECVAAEIGPEGVTIAGVAPGTMVAERFLERGADLDADGELGMLFAEAWSRTSIGRFSYPEEVANTVAFLVSDAGAYIHGTTVRVAGGQ